MGCRQNQFVGLLLIAGGVGMLISLFIPSAFWRILIGVVLIVAGYLVSRSK